jgi:hypothetical protein
LAISSLRAVRYSTAASLACRNNASGISKVVSMQQYCCIYAPMSKQENATVFPIFCGSKKFA